MTLYAFFYQSCLDLVGEPHPVVNVAQIVKAGGMSRPIQPDLVKKIRMMCIFSRIVGPALSIRFMETASNCHQSFAVSWKARTSVESWRTLEKSLT